MRESIICSTRYILAKIWEGFSCTNDEFLKNKPHISKTQYSKFSTTQPNPQI